MRRVVKLAVLFAALLAPPAEAWNNAGHRLIAALAYDELTPAARAGVDELLRRHPDYELFVKGTPEDPSARARAAFLAASFWADMIRSDPRFYDESGSDAVPTPALAGFPSMERHRAWHFINLPISADGTPVKPPSAPNLLAELERLMRDLGDSVLSPAQRSYDLVWLLHLVGDVHQPLHCIRWFSEAHPEGDGGGNRFFVEGRQSLHAFWDQLAGTDSSDANLARMVREIRGEYQEPLGLAQGARSGVPDAWLEDSVHWAQERVLAFGGQKGTSEESAVFPIGYRDMARLLARQQWALAGHRLAEILTSSFRNSGPSTGRN